MPLPFRALLTAFVLGLASRAEAAPAWSAPESCPAPPLAELAPAEQQALTSGSVRVAVRAVAGGWAASLAPSADAGDSRKLRSADCAELNRAVRVTLSLLYVEPGPSSPPAAAPPTPSPGAVPSAPAPQTPSNAAPPAVVPPPPAPSTSAAPSATPPIATGPLAPSAADVPAADVPAADVPAADVPAVDVPAASWTSLDGLAPSPEAENSSALPALTPNAQSERSGTRTAPLQSREGRLLDTNTLRAAKSDGAKGARPAADRHPLQIVIAPGLEGGLEGTTPWTLGGALGVGVWRSAFGARGAAGFRAPLAALETDQGVRTKFTVLSFGLEGCWRFDTPWTGSLCLGPLTERVQAQSEGISTPNSDARWLFGGQATAAWHWRLLRRVGVFAAVRAELRAPLEFNVRPYSEPVFEYPALGTQLLLGPEFWL